MSKNGQFASAGERKRTLAQDIFFHYRLVGTRKFFSSTEDPDEIAVEEVTREEHWGRKETCAKCRKHRLPMADFKNCLALPGYFLVGFAIAIVLAAAFVVAVLRSGWVHVWPGV